MPDNKTQGVFDYYQSRLSMLDGIKIVVDKESAENILKALDKETFDFKVDKTTGEIKKQSVSLKIGHNHKLKFSVFQNMAIVEVSLHAYLYGNNYGKFTYADCCKAIYKLCKDYGINPKTAIVQNVEIGANLILTNARAKHFIDSAQLHKTQTFTLRDFSNHGQIKQFEHQRYIVKMYEKGTQFSIPIDYLRFEKKMMKMIELSNYNHEIKLIDLLNTELLEIALLGLSECAKNLTVLEPFINSSGLSRPQKRLKTDFEKNGYLQDLARNNQRKLRAEKKKYLVLVEKACKEPIYKDFLAKLEQSITEFKKGMYSQKTAQMNETKKDVEINQHAKRLYL